MQRTDFTNLQCPVARSLERTGEWWSILIMRDTFYGLYANTGTKEAADLVMIDRISGRPMSDPVLGPAAGQAIMQRMAKVKAAAPQTAYTA